LDFDACEVLRVKNSAIRISILFFLALSSVLMIDSRVAPVQGQPSIAVVGVWNNDCGSFNITLSNPACQTLNLAPNNQLSVQINVTNAISINGFELALFYDSHYLQAIRIDTAGTPLNPTIFGRKAFNFKNVTSNPGIVLLSVTALGRSAPFTGNGLLANIIFNIVGVGVSPLTLAAGMIAPTSHAQGAGGIKPDYTDLVQTTPAGVTSYEDIQTADGYFTNIVGTADNLISGTPPRSGTNLSVDSKIKFVDSPPAGAPNSPGTWAPGKTAIYDIDGDGIFNAPSTPSDVVISGTAPTAGTNLSVDSKIKFVDSPPAGAPNSPGTWAPSKAVIYDTDSSGTFDPKLGPVAQYTFSPRPAVEGFDVNFNATASFDSDNPVSGITQYVWDFGDGGYENNSVPITRHPYIRGFLGNFTARLTVVDKDDGFQGMAVQRVEVIRSPKHDIAINSVTVTPALISPGQKVSVQVIVANQGTFPENYTLTVNYGPPTKSIGNETGRLTALATKTYEYAINTAGFTPNTYTVVATASIPIDNDTSNNIGKAIFVVAWPSNAPFLYLLSGGAGAVALVSAGGILLRRRRMRIAEIEEREGPKRRTRSR